LKGKGKHKTFWLVGKEGFDKELPDPVFSENNHGIDADLIKKIEQIRAEQKIRDHENSLKPVDGSSSAAHDPKSNPSSRPVTPNLFNKATIENENELEKIALENSTRRKRSSVKTDSGFVESPPNLSHTSTNQALNTINGKVKRMPVIESVA
jgi:hypothetical protein